jgi:hypothetical protein
MGNSAEKPITNYEQAMEYTTTCMNRYSATSQLDPSKVYHNDLIKSNIRIIGMFKNILPNLSQTLIVNEKSLLIDTALAITEDM